MIKMIQIRLETQSSTSTSAQNVNSLHLVNKDLYLLQCTLCGHKKLQRQIDTLTVSQSTSLSPHVTCHFPLFVGCPESVSEMPEKEP